MKINVIIPVYNCKLYLEETIKSIVNQDYYKEYVLIVLVDDGSTDGSSELCDILASKYENIVTLHYENGGVSLARNRGIEYVSMMTDNASSNYICFLDSDDCWARNFIDDKVVGNLNKGYEIIGYNSCDCSYNMFYRQKANASQYGEFIYNELDTKSIFVHNSSFGAAFYSVFFLNKNKIRFFEDLKYTEDKIFKIHCFYYACKVLLEEKIMYLYRIHKDSAVHRRRFGIEYFKPIINAYVKCDDIVNKNIINNNLKLKVGHIFASKYLSNMIIEEMQNFGSKSLILKEFDNNEYWIKLIYGSTEFGKITYNEQCINLIDSLKCNLISTILKHYVYGCVYKVARVIRYFPIIKSVVNKKRFPYKNELY